MAKKPQQQRKERTPEREMNPALRYALRMVETYAWHLIPLHAWVEGRTRSGCSCGRENCEAPGKHPIPHNGLNGSTNRPDIIHAWWDKWPWANVGLRTGAINGIVVLDVDPRSGGTDALDALEAKHGKLPQTAEVLTGGGGRHLYFKHPGGVVRNSAGKIGQGLDIRGDGGYVVGPGSLHQSGQRYGFELSSTPSESGFAEVPGWMLELLMSQQTRMNKAVQGQTTIPEGYRNHYLASVAGTLHKRGVSQDAILACLMAENVARLNPPMQDDEVRKIAWSISTYPGGNPLEWVRFIERMPRTAKMLEEHRLTFGEGSQLTYASEGGHRIGNPSP